jgi:hypothetical protein
MTTMPIELALARTSAAKILIAEEYYLFAGEIPWSPEFAYELGKAGFEQPYLHQIAINGQGHIEVEILAHRFAWESYHSQLNQAGGAYVPSKTFSQKFDLRGIPQSFD